jgi:sugar phosphate isomerase/epimerase
MTAVRGAGFSSGVHDDSNFEQLRRNLTEAEKLGVDFVELPIFAMDLVAGGRVLPSQLRRLKEALAGRGFGFTVHGPIAVNFMQEDAAGRHLAVAKAYVEIAGEIGAAHLILHTGHTLEQNETALEAAYACQREAFAELGESAAANSVILAVENIFVSEDGRHTALPSRLAKEIETIGHPNVRACLDFSHAAILCKARGASFIEEAKALARVARHLHIHDSFGDPTQLRTHTRSERVAYGLGDLHLPIGWGVLPWHEMMASFEFEPNVIFNLELPVQYWFALSDSVRSVKEMAETYKARRSNV